MMQLDTKNIGVELKRDKLKFKIHIVGFITIILSFSVYYTLIVIFTLKEVALNPESKE